MRNTLQWLFLSLLCLLGTVSSAQVFKIYGETVINCNFELQRYLIETDQMLLGTHWSITPSGAQILSFTDISATIEFLAPGTYILFATSTTPNNQVITDSLLIQVNFTTLFYEISGCYEQENDTSCYNVCAHSTVSLYSDLQGSNLSITGAESYEYVSSNQVDITWGAGGYGEIVINNGCEIHLCFDILPEPVADFSSDPAIVNDTISACKLEEIHFINESQNGLSYTWNFGDGAQSDDFHASHAYGQTGFFEVTLIAQSICDCHDEKKVIVAILPTPVPELDCINSVCPETKQRYTASSDDCTDFGWSVSSNGTIVDGGESGDDYVEVIWHSGPDGFITLTLNGCTTSYCTNQSVFRIPVITSDGPVEGDASVCPGEITTYTAPFFPGTVYQWMTGPSGTIIDGGQSNTVTIQWDPVDQQVNTFVSVVYENCFLECGGSASLPVLIVPEINLVGPDHVCGNESIVIAAEAGFSSPMPAPVSWHIENAAGQVVYSEPGLLAVFNHTFNYPPGRYTVVAVNQNSAYCSEEVSLQVQITPIPEIPIGIKGPDVICPGIPYGFTIEPSGIYNTVWTITDGLMTTTLQGQTCQYSFGNTPPYTITAYHTDLQFGACASGSVTKNIQPISGIVIEGADEACLYGIDTFRFEPVEGALFYWEIIPDDMGEIRRNGLNQAEIFWTKSGNATVKLHACGSTFDKNVAIHDPPVFNLLGPMSVCANETAMISTDVPGLDHLWETADHTIISSANSVSLPPGSYILTVTSPFGCPAEMNFEILPLPAPKVNITSTGGESFCNSVPSDLYLVTNTDGAGYTFLWYKDGVPTGVTTPDYSVADFGKYYVEVVNQHGCRDISPEIEIVNCCPPNNCFGGGGGPPGGCQFADTDFDIDKSGPTCNDRTYTPQVPIVSGSASWFIKSAGEGTIHISIQDACSFIYPLPGYYQVTVFAKLQGFPYTPSLCVHGQTFTDTIRAVADFDVHNACINTNVDFEDLTTFIPGESITSWSWNFGDPSSGAANLSSLQHPVHLFSAAGDYNVTLSVVVAGGCTTNIQKTVHISDGPSLNPIVDPIYCEHEAQAFFLPDNAYNILWDFDDPSSGIQNQAGGNQVFHTYDVVASYLPAVSARDEYGCLSQVSIPTEIIPNGLSGMISVLPGSTLCYGDTATLTSPAGGVEWLWNTDETTVAIEVAETGNYQVQVVDQYHCTYSPPPEFVEFLPKPQVIIRARELYGAGEYGPWDTTLQMCYGTEFELQAFGVGGSSYEWSDGSIIQVIQFTDEGGNLPGPGTYEYYVILQSGITSCFSDTAFISFEVFPLPAMPVISLMSGSGCAFNDNTFQVNAPVAGITYVWSNGETGPVMTTEDAGSYYVTAINDNGCARHSFSLDIKPSAQIDQIPGGCFEECDPLTVCLPPLANVASYQIFLNGSSFDSGTAWPADFLVSQDGAYTFEVTSTNGCTALSDPLDIVLYTGVGSVTVEVWFDADGNGVISGGDVLLPDIEVEIQSDDLQHHGSAPTNAEGYFEFTDYPATDYIAYFDRNLLSSQYRVILDSVQADIATCDDSVVVSLLLDLNCTVTGPDQQFSLCPGDTLMLGDSIWTDTGTYVMHMLSDLGCDSVFQVELTIPDSLHFDVTVWVDVDHSGTLSPADTVISNIELLFSDLNNPLTYTGITGSNGTFSDEFQNGFYKIEIVTQFLPPDLDTIIGSAFNSTAACGSGSYDLLLGSICSPVMQVQQASLCPGDSFLVENQWLSDPGMYSFVISDPGAPCDTTLDVFVELFPDINIDGTQDWNCATLGTIMVDVTGDGPFQYMWIPPQSGDTLLTFLPEGTYTLIVTDANGCAAADTFSIEGNDLLAFGLPPVFTLVAGDSVLVTILGDTTIPGLTIQWYPPDIVACDTCFSTLAFPTQSGVLTALLTDEYGCSYGVETYLEVTFDSSLIDRLYVPNVFTPNGDGINDHWRMYSRLNNAFVNQLVIFDRWGTMVLQKSNYALDSFEGWDGTFKGKPYNPGVFTFMADLTLSDDTPVLVKGNITLLR